MKLALLCVLILGWSMVDAQIHGQKKDNQVLVHGIIRNFRNVVEVEDKGDTESLQIADSDRSFVPDREGRFSIEFALDRPKYFRIARNTVYLSPGDNLEVDIDYNNAENSTFKGRNSQQNKYLKHTPYPKAGSFLEAGTNVKSTIEQTIKRILELANQRRQSLHNYKSFSNQFRSFEDNRINADIINSLYSLRTYFPYVHKLKDEELAAFQKIFLNKIDSIARKLVTVRLDAKLLNLEVYRDMLPIVLKLSDSKSKDTAQIYDWLLAKKIVHEMQTSPTLRDSIAFENKIDLIKTINYRREVIATYRKLLSYNGNEAADILLIDVKKNRLNLSSFRGKIIYIDVWATWCGPCIKELPYLDSLKKRYKDNLNVVFLSLSIDSDISSWLKYVNDTEFPVFQYSVDLMMLKPYYVSEIPRTILIDKNFKIYAMRGPMPSSAESVEIIQKMLQEN